MPICVQFFYELYNLNNLLQDQVQFSLYKKANEFKFKT